MMTGTAQDVVEVTDRRSGRRRERPAAGLGDERRASSELSPLAVESLRQPLVADGFGSSVRHAGDDDDRASPPVSPHGSPAA